MDAEGYAGEEACPDCGSLDTVSYHYAEGFDELECRRCGYSSEAADIDSLTRYAGTLSERDETGALPPIPIKKLKA